MSVSFCFSSSSSSIYWNVINDKRKDHNNSTGFITITKGKQIKYNETNKHSTRVLKQLPVKEVWRIQGQQQSTTLSLILAMSEIELENFCSMTPPSLAIQLIRSNVRGWLSIFLKRRTSCLTVSKALEKSRAMMWTKGLEASSEVTEWRMSLRTAVVEAVGLKTNWSERRGEKTWLEKERIEASLDNLFFKDSGQKRGQRYESKVWRGDRLRNFGDRHNKRNLSLTGY